MFSSYLKELKELNHRNIVVNDEIPDSMPGRRKIERPTFDNPNPTDKNFKEAMDAYFQESVIQSMKDMQLKEAYNSVGMYAFVSWKWCLPFVDWINGRKVLEVMAGRGWLSYALRQKGVDVIATDDYSWFDKHGWGQPLTEVEELDALASVHKYGKDIDILVMGWPYMDNTAYRVIHDLHKVNPSALVVFIGENSGGCTADDDFFEHFKEVEDKTFAIVNKNYERWPHIHDEIQLGKYKPE